VTQRASLLKFSVSIEEKFLPVTIFKGYVEDLNMSLVVLGSKGVYFLKVDKAIFDEGSTGVLMDEVA
jgi:hypothetical protein